MNWHKFFIAPRISTFFNHFFFTFIYVMFEHHIIIIYFFKNNLGSVGSNHEAEKFWLPLMVTLHL